MRLEHNHHLILRQRLVDVGKDVAQERNLRQPGNAAYRFHLLPLKNPPDNVDLSFAEADVVLDDPLPNDRLLDSADVDALGDRRDFDPDLESNFAVGVHLGRNVQVHSYVGVLELRLNQGTDDRTSNAGLKRAGSDGHPVADPQGGFLAVRGSDLRPLEDFGVGVVHQGSELGARQREGVVRRTQGPEPVERQRACGGRRRCRAQDRGPRLGGRGGGGGGLPARRISQRNLESGCAAGGDREKADLLRPVPAGLQHHHIHHHFGLGFVHVANDLFGDGHLVGSVPDDDGVQRVDLLDAARLQQTPDRRYDFRQFLRSNGVREVERLDDLLLLLPALDGSVRDHQDGIARQDLPKRLRQQANLFERFLQSDVVQLDRDPLARIVRVKQNIDARELADGLDHHLGFVRHAQTDGSARERLQLRRAERLLEGRPVARSFRRGNRLRRARGRLLLLFQQGAGPLDFLEGNRDGRIEGGSPLVLR